MPIKHGLTILLVPHNRKKSMSIRLEGWKVVAVAVILFLGIILFVVGIVLGGRSAKLIAENRALHAENRMLRQERVKIIKLEKELASTSALREWMTKAVGGEAKKGSAPAFASTGSAGLTAILDNPLKTSLFPELETAAAEARRRRDFVPRGLPVEGAITARFGEMSGRYLKPHSGVDIAAPKGSIVAATAAGVVAAVTSDTQLGNTVEIDHLNGYVTRFGHLEAISVKKGDWVERGDRIGIIGSTGHAEGIHVHYAVELNGK
ncbi:M23 family metallopeptidase, partial [bacterium]|nr:M23 family metallopeptidase [bacterium]